MTGESVEAAWLRHSVVIGWRFPRVREREEKNERRRHGLGCSVNRVTWRE